MQLVVQYLTKTAINLPSAGDNTRSSVQHPLLFVRYCPWCTGQDGVTVIHSRVNGSIDERGQRVRVQIHTGRFFNSEIRDCGTLNPGISGVQNAAGIPRYSSR